MEHSDFAEGSEASSSRDSAPSETTSDGLPPNDCGSTAYGTSPATSGTNGHFTLKTSLFSSQVRRDVGGEIFNQAGNILSYQMLAPSPHERTSLQDSTPRRCSKESDAALIGYFKQLQPSPAIKAWLQEVVPSPTHSKKEECASQQPEPTKTKTVPASLSEEQNLAQPLAGAISQSQNQTDSIGEVSHTKSKEENTEDEAEDSSDSQHA